MALLGEVQRLFERAYGRPAGVELEACVVGPRRCAELASRSAGHPEMSDWARFFFYVEDANLRLALFYADEMIEALEELDPRRGLSESNVLPLLVFTEEASHALHTTYAFGEGGPDRVAGEEFGLTQLFLAQMLGVRRASVSEVAGRLQERGLIEYRRGQVRITDRAGLERASCVCYAIIRAEFDRLLGSADAVASPLDRGAYSSGGDTTTKPPDERD